MRVLESRSIVLNNNAERAVSGILLAGEGAPDIIVQTHMSLSRQTITSVWPTRRFLVMCRCARMKLWMRLLHRLSSESASQTVLAGNPMRAYIDATTSCNNCCRFCKVHVSNPGTASKALDAIEYELLEARATGLSFVVFSGGEVTTRPDLVSLIKMARGFGFTDIQLQTNGRHFADPKNCDSVIEAGVTEFLISIHGFDADTHDWHTRQPGSYSQTVMGIRNLVNKGAVVLTNTVITKRNYTHLANIVRLVASLGVSTIQLAYLHLVGTAAIRADELLVRKKHVSTYVCRALDEETSSRTYKMVEAIPYCLLPGHEQFCADLYATTTYLRQNKEFGAYDKSIVRAKGPRCKECNLDEICYGPWKEYPDLFGWDEFVPVSGFSVESLVRESVLRDVSGDLR